MLILKYIFDKYISIYDFVNHISSINSSIIVFDDKVESCFVNKGLNVLAKKKILIDIDLYEKNIYHN